MPSATTIQCPPTCTPSMSRTARSSGLSGVARHASSCAWGLRDKASTDRTLARAPRGDIRAERVQTPPILTGRHANEHLVDDTPVQRVRVRKCPRGGQRHLRAAAPGARSADGDLPPAQAPPDWGYDRRDRPAARVDVHTGARTQRTDLLPAWPRAPSGPNATTSSWSSACVSTRISTNGRCRGVGDTDWRRRGTVRDCFFMAAPCWEAFTSVSSPVV